MDILKAATDWAKAEVFSSTFFILAGLLFVAISIGFWQLGKTEVAKSFVTPVLVCGVLLLAVGSGIFYANKTRVTSFAEAHAADAQAFVKSEIVRTEQSMKEYKNIVFKVIPGMIVACALIIVFTGNPTWRAISIATIAMLVVILIVDSNANARLLDYHDQLIEADTSE